MADLEFTESPAGNNQEPEKPEPQVQELSTKTKPKKAIFIIVALAILVLIGLEIYIYIRRNQSEDNQPINPPTISQSEPTPTSISEKSLDDEEKDTDGDGYSDQEEIATGYDPLVDDCADQFGCQLDQEFKNSQPLNVLFILDASGSMAGLVSGQTKMAVAKESIKEYVKEIGSQVNFGLLVYGHMGSNSQTDKQLSCNSSELLYPISRPDQGEFNQSIDSFGPVGWTPIADSLTLAQNEAFMDKEGENNKIILISDGIETCGGDPCQVARQLKQSGIETIIDVIGFDVDQAARQQLECIAEATGGVYHHAQDAEEFKAAMGLIQANLEQAINYSQCLIKNGLKISQCKIQKANIISRYRLQKATED